VPQAASPEAFTVKTALITRAGRLLPWAVLLILIPGRRAAAGLEVLDSYAHCDRPFPQYVRFWHEDANLEEAVTEGTDARAQAEAVGGSLHVLVRNAGPVPLEIRDVAMAGISLDRAIAVSGQRKTKVFASIHFAHLPADQLQRLIDAGEPVWFRVDPETIAPGGTGEVVVRLRRIAPAGVGRGERSLVLLHGDGQTMVRVPVDRDRPRFESISFSRDLRTAFLYTHAPASPAAGPLRIRLDGRDVTASAKTALDRGCDTACTVLALDPAPPAASFRCFQAEYPGGATAAAGLRVWADDFAYGIFGGKPGEAGDERIARQYVDDITGHHINLQMPQIGSSAVQSFFKSQAGRDYCAARGLRFILPEAGKFGVRDPFAYYLHDEPDCGDYKAQGLPADRKIGAMGRYVVQRGMEIRRADPLVPQMVNVDMTFKPQNWYTYGQIADLLAADPYYQARLRTAWTRHPERKEMYARATYVYAVGEVCRAACAPRPLHLILYSVAHVDKDTGQRFRCATPAEKRIEVYYALAAGARGLSYWWYTPGRPSRGVGAAGSDPDLAALWEEIGRLGAEVRAAGPLLLNACPVRRELEASAGLWGRTLAVGHETLVLLAVNDRHRNDDHGTTLDPVRDATVRLEAPGGTKVAEAFEITPGGTRDVNARMSGTQLELRLGDVEAARMFVVTSDKGLRAALQAGTRRQP